MLIYVGEPHYKLITAIEGTGDNLLPEDEADGLVDYLMSSVYEMEGEEINLLDSGQIMSSDYFADMEEEEVIQRVLEYWGVHEDNYVILER